MDTYLQIVRFHAEYSQAYYSLPDRNTTETLPQLLNVNLLMHRFETFMTTTHNYYFMLIPQQKQNLIKILLSNIKATHNKIVDHIESASDKTATTIIRLHF